MTAYNEQAITLLEPGAQTGDSGGASVDCGSKSMVSLSLACSAASGSSPTLDVAIQTSADGASWNQLGAFTRLSAMSTQQLALAGGMRYLRARWTLGGTTPSFTFGVTGSAFLVYATPADISRFALPAKALNASSSDIAKAIKGASEKIDGLFNDRYAYPLVAWGDDLTEAVCKLAGFTLLTTRGVSPESSDWEILKDMRDSALKWASDVGQKHISPLSIVDSSSSVEENEAFVYSRAKRGWS